MSASRTSNDLPSTPLKPGGKKILALLPFLIILILSVPAEAFDVGVDYHDESVRVCVLAEDGRELVNRNLPNDPGSVRDLVSRFGLARQVVIEACCGAADFAAELIRQTDWDVQLAHPGYVNRMKQGPDKTDMGDAWLLADLGRVNYVPTVWLADETTSS